MFNIENGKTFHVRKRVGGVKPDKKVDWERCDNLGSKEGGIGRSWFPLFFG